MAPKSKKITSKTDPKTEAKNHPKIDLKLTPNGAQMEPKRHQQINDFLAQFSDPSGNIDGISTELRRSRECHTFSSGPPRAAPYYQRLLYNNKQRRVACRILHASGRWPSEFLKFLHPTIFEQRVENYSRFALTPPAHWVPRPLLKFDGRPEI